MRTRYRYQDGPAEAVTPNWETEQNLPLGLERGRIEMDGPNLPLLPTAKKNRAKVAAASAASARVEIVVYKFGRRRIQKRRS